MGPMIDFQELISQGKYNEIIGKINKIEDPSDRHLLYKCEALIYEGSFDQANDIITELIDSEVVLIKIEALRQKSLIHWSLGELSQSGRYSDKAINLLATIDSINIESKAIEAIEAHVYHTYGTVCQNLGKLDESLKYL